MDESVKTLITIGLFAFGIYYLRTQTTLGNPVVNRYNKAEQDSFTHSPLLEYIGQNPKRYDYFYTDGRKYVHGS